MKINKKIITIGIIIACLLVYFFVPSVNQGINRAIRVLTTEGIDGIAAYIRSFGVYAVIVSFLLMVLQSIISPIPAFFITLANSAISAGLTAPFSLGLPPWQVPHFAFIFPEF